MIYGILVNDIIIQCFILYLQSLPTVLVQTFAVFKQTGCDY